MRGRSLAGFLVLACSVTALIVWLLGESPGAGPARLPSASSVADGDAAVARREPGACAVRVSAGDHLSDEAIAAATLDAIDPATGRARAEPSAPGRARVKSCRGTYVEVETARLSRTAVVSTLIGGGPELIERRSLGSSVMARVIVGERDGESCLSPVGFLVLASLREQRVEVDALGSFTGSCGGSESFTAMDLGTQVAFLEALAPEHEGPARISTARVFVREGPLLQELGNVSTELEDVDVDGDLPLPGWRRTMTAELSASDGVLLAKESWALTPLDGGTPLRRTLQRAYAVRDGKLERSPAGAVRP